MNKSELLKSIQGKWTRKVGEKVHEIEISDDSVILEGKDKTSLVWQNDSQWVIPGVIQLVFLNSNNKDELSCLVPDNGPIPGYVILYDKVK